MFRSLLGRFNKHSSDSPGSENPHPKYWILLVFAVLVAFGPTVLINQSLWDDWPTRAYAHSGTLWELSKQAGTREAFPLLQLFASASEPRLVIVAELLLFGLLAPLIYTVIRRTTRWPVQDAFWAALLTALAPLNQARFTLVTLTYGFSCVCFAASLVLLLRDLDRPAVVRRIFAGLLLAMAFATNSFLVLAWIPALLVAVDAWRKTKAPSFLTRTRLVAWAVIGRAELLLLPPLYWAAKQTFEPTSGLYENYNKFRISPLEALIDSFVAFFDQFAEAGLLLPAHSHLLGLAIIVTIAIAFFAALAWWWRLPLFARDRDQCGWNVSGRILAVVIAFALIISALFPYVLVGKPPRFHGLWETRNQTTLMMVSGFALVAFLRLFTPWIFGWAAAVAVGFLTIDVSVTHRIIADALETRTIADLFKQQPSPPGTMMLVLENDRQYRALDRSFPFYEISWLVNPPGGSGSPRIAVSNQELQDPETRTFPSRFIPGAVDTLVGLCQKYRAHPPYGFAGFVSNGTVETVSIVADGPPPGPLRTMLEALRSDPSKSPISIRLLRETRPIAGCTSACCRGS
jgi:hypothetical protein